jgi:DNA-binding MarR family transcriptional regulator
VASKKTPLTVIQQQVYQYLRDCKTPPALREISAHFGWTQSGSVHHLDALEKKKWIRRIPNQARNIRLR